MSDILLVAGISACARCRLQSDPSGGDYDSLRAGLVLASASAFAGHLRNGSSLLSPVPCWPLMLGRSCPRCGRQLRSGGTYCPFCDANGPGTPIVKLPSRPAGVTENRWVVPPPAYDTAGGASGRITPTLASRPFDRVALKQVLLAALLALANALSVILVSVAFSEWGSLVTFAGATGGVTVSVPPLWVAIALAISGAIIAIAEILAFRAAFGGLAYFDRRFATPAKLASLMLIGSLVVLVAGVVLLDFLYGAVQCAGTGNVVPASCISLSTLWLGLALAGVGGLVTLVGYLGVVVGVWRLGGRYRVGLFRVGAVLLLIPFVSALGSIIVAFGAWRHLLRLEGPSGR